MRNGECTDVCVREHEQFHRDECGHEDYLELEQCRSYWVGEALAYIDEYDCLKKAIFEAPVDVEVDPFGPDSFVTDSP